MEVFRAQVWGGAFLASPLHINRHPGGQVGELGAHALGLVNLTFFLANCFIALNDFYAMKHIWYDIGFYFPSFMRPISGLLLISLNVLSTW